jgi:hypothetical protein
MDMEILVVSIPVDQDLVVAAVVDPVELEMSEYRAALALVV